MSFCGFGSFSLGFRPAFLPPLPRGVCLPSAVHCIAVFSFFFCAYCWSSLELVSCCWPWSSGLAVQVVIVRVVLSGVLSPCFRARLLNLEAPEHCSGPAAADLAVASLEALAHSHWPWRAGLGALALEALLP